MTNDKTTALIAECRDALQACIPYMEYSSFSGAYSKKQAMEQIERCEEALAAFEQLTGTVSFHPESDIGRARAKAGLPLTVPFEQPAVSEGELVRVAGSAYMNSGHDMGCYSAKAMQQAIIALRNLGVLTNVTWGE